MKKALFIDAVGILDTDLLEEYVKRDQMLRDRHIAQRRKGKRYLVTFMAAALAMLLCVALLVTSLPLIYVFNAQEINSAVSKGVESILFPLDKKTEDGMPVNKEDLLINWVEWKFAREFFAALGAGTEDSMIERMQAAQGNGLISESVHGLGNFLAKLYGYYSRHKEGTEVSPDELETENGKETGDETDPSYDVDGSVGLGYQKDYQNNTYMVSYIKDCTDEVIIIPTSYKGLPVVGIYEGAFEDCTTLKEIVLHDGIRSQI